jgi:hypothetical protein
MTDFIRRRPLLSAFLGVIILVVVLGSFQIVPETKQAVVVRFGKPERILNRFEPGRPIGTAGAGLPLALPGRRPCGADLARGAGALGQFRLAHQIGDAKGSRARAA